MAQFIYDSENYNDKSALEVLPFIFNMYKPSSVVDVGCGLGNWLHVARELGVPKVAGIDTDHFDSVKRGLSSSEYFCHDLNKPLVNFEKFDLVICLEVAEHLAAESAENLIKTLTGLGEIILFSAAIPGQGGQDHLNEQWPDYWQQKFYTQDYIFLDCLRPRIWNNSNIKFWYRQNIFLVVKKGNFLLEKQAPSTTILPLVHPELFRLSSLNSNRQIERLKLLSDSPLSFLKSFVKKRLKIFF
jgi:SAM-dependent methyltransferase